MPKRWHVQAVWSTAHRRRCHLGGPRGCSGVPWALQATRAPARATWAMKPTVVNRWCQSPSSTGLRQCPRGWGSRGGGGCARSRHGGTLSRTHRGGWGSLHAWWSDWSTGTEQAAQAGELHSEPYTPPGQAALPHPSTASQLAPICKGHKDVPCIGVGPVPRGVRPPPAPATWQRTV